MHRHLLLISLTVTAACGGSNYPGITAVRPGIEVLLEDSLHLVAGRRVGLVTNQAGVDGQGVHDVERLLAADIDLTALFSPEHGFRGSAAPGELVDHSVDSATGLPIYSLYGRTAEPSPEMLAEVDVILIDLQDSGARYYTYITTTGRVMAAAGRAGVPVVILDRPNPLGRMAQGNVLDTAFRSAVGYLAVPMRHGLTLGEMALLAVQQRNIVVDLTVVPVSGWDPEQAYDATGLPFVRPSPNLPDLESLFHYPGLCLFEGTALSVGRGTSHPFSQIGAPWLAPAEVLASLSGYQLPGVSFAAVSFTPQSPGDGKFDGTTVQGIRLSVTDRSRYDPTVTAVALLAAVLEHHPDRIGWIPSHFDRLAGTDSLRLGLAAGSAPGPLAAGWPGQVEEFRVAAGPVLLYR